MLNQDISDLSTSLARSVATSWSEPHRAHLDEEGRECNGRDGGDAVHSGSGSPPEN